MAEQISLFDIAIDDLDMLGTVNTIMSWLDEFKDEFNNQVAEDVVSDGPPCRYVVTPNVDHVVMLQKNQALRDAYADAALVVADGFPLVVASKLLGTPLPERVAGSELVEVFFDALQERGRSVRVYLLGAMPGVAVRAARRIDRDWPNVNVVGTYSPPIGFENDEEECEAILQRIERDDPEVVILGVGAPKQEVWTHRFHDRLRGRVVFCVGATIDFLAGEKPQAPVWMRRCGLEWLHRCASEPKRLIKRYLTGAFVFPQIVFREWASRRS